MQLNQLEHLIRAAGTVTDRYEFVVVGSQSILGSVARPPLECLVSIEADIYPKGAEELSDKIDGAGLVDANRALQCVTDMPVSDAVRLHMAALIVRLAAQATSAGPLPS